MLTTAEALNPTNRHLRESVVEYYDFCEVDYRWYWDLGSSLAMHMGYWDASTRSLRDALRRQNEVLAETVGITPRDRVLDAGCGVGGSSVFLANEIGCRVVGITLSRKQAMSATRNARRLGVDDRVQFACSDYLCTGFPDASFDVVWALESVCYAESKRTFVFEAARLLRPGGRLILADGFAMKEALTDLDEARMRRSVGNWAVPHLETPSRFRGYLEDAEFVDVNFVDVTATVLPSLRRLFLHSLYGAPLSRLAQLVGIRRGVQTRNVVGTLHAYQTCRKGLLGYGMFSARRP